MSAKGFIVEDGIVAGNVYDKYHTSNPIARRLVQGFQNAFDELLVRSGARDIHEVGCGEGEVAMRMARAGYVVRASDFSEQIVARARMAAAKEGLTVDFRVRSIYQLDPAVDAAELVVASEILEHLDDPVAALEKLATIARPYLLVSVPNEPLWRVLNVCRGKYLRDLGNTPGHVRHWSHAALLDLLRSRFDVIETRRPIPWSMALCRAR